MVRTITREVFEASDGRIFDSEKAAIEHEESLKEVKYFKVHYSPDLTEGRTCSQATGLIGVCATDSHRSFAEHACFELFGSRWSFVQGVFGANAIMPNWTISGDHQHPDGTKLIATVQARFTKNLVWKLGVHKLP